MKKQSKTNKRNSTRATKSDDAVFDELGLEPPRIYRKSQEAINQGQRKINDTKSRINSNTRSGMTKSQRRVKETKKRHLKNGVRKFLIWVGVICLLLGIGTVLSLTVFFNINSIEVSGSKIYSKEEILQMCTIDKGENLFMSDTNKAKAVIEEKLPYVHDAEIKRKLPDKIVITIKDGTAAYSLKQKDKTYILLDDNFKVLEKGAQKASGIKITKADVKAAEPGTEVVFKKESEGKCLKAMADCIRENKFVEITGIKCNNISDNCVVYDNRITFKLGNIDDLENKIYKGLATCEKLDENSPNVEGTLTIGSDKSVYFTES